MYGDSACADNATRLPRYGAKVPLDNLLCLFGGAVTKAPKMSSIDRRVHELQALHTKA